MRAWKDSRWLPRTCVILYVTMLVIVVQLAWGCAERTELNNNTPMDSPQLVLPPQEFDDPFPSISIMVLSGKEVLGLPCYPDSTGEIICPTVTFWRDTVYVVGEIRPDSITTNCIVEDPDNCVQ